MATYYVWSGATGAADGSSFTDAYVSLDALFTGQAIAGGDIIKIASDHDASYGASKTFTCPESGADTAAHVFLISTNRTSGDPEAGAIEGSGGNFTLRLAGRVAAYGVTFKAGTGGAHIAADLALAASSGTEYGPQLYINCKFIINSTHTGSEFRTSANSSLHKFIFYGCEFNAANTTGIQLLGADSVEFYNCTVTGTSRTNIFSSTSSFTQPIIASGCDFSAGTNLFDSSGVYLCMGVFKNCKVPSSIASNYAGPAGQFDVELHACDSTDHNYQYTRYHDNGRVDTDVSVYLTSGGATQTDNDGTAVNFSHKIVSGEQAYYCNIARPMYTPWYHVPIFSTGSKTLSIKVAHTAAAALKDTECWIEIDAMAGGATATTPMTEICSSMPVVGSTVFPNLIATGSNLSDTAEAWTGITSEITHTVSKTITVNNQGWARARIGLAKENFTLYVNPDVAVT